MSQPPSVPTPATPKATDQGKKKSGDMIKYAILIAFIVIGGGMVYMDSAKVTPATNKALEEMAAACQSQQEHTSEMVQEITGFKPSSTEEKEGNVTVETYFFKRAIPFMTSATAHALYLDGKLKKVVSNRELTEEDLKYVRFFND